MCSRVTSARRTARSDDSSISGSAVISGSTDLRVEVAEQGTCSVAFVVVAGKDRDAHVGGTRVAIVAEPVGDVILRPGDYEVGRTGDAFGFHHVLVRGEGS